MPDNNEDIFTAVADPGFSPGGAPTPKSAIIFQFFAENCMKMKEFGPPGGGARVPGAPPWIRQCTGTSLSRKTSKTRVKINIGSVNRYPT